MIAAKMLVPLLSFVFNKKLNNNNSQAEEEYEGMRMKFLYYRIPTSDDQMLAMYVYILSVDIQRNASPL